MATINDESLAGLYFGKLKNHHNSPNLSLRINYACLLLAIQ